MTRQKTALAAAALAGALLADGLIPRIVAQPLPASVPDPGALRDQVVLQLPIDPYRDIAATWRAVTGGWRTVNGYSGYGPNYYGRLLQASQQADDALFAPFQREHDLQVIVADDAEALKTLVARQPGAVLIARGSGASQYRLPRREPLATAKGGDALPIVMVRSDCASTSVALAFDDDERSMWECRQPVASHELTIDLGTVAPVGSVEYSVGPYSWNTPSQLLIETSVDGAVWMEARRGSIIGELIAGGLREPAALRAVLPFAPRAGRYVRIRPIAQPADFVWFVAELKVRRP
jgi:hypothetical protein